MSPLRENYLLVLFVQVLSELQGHSGTESK